MLYSREIVADGEQSVRSGVIQAALVALGLIIGGWVLGTEIKATRLNDRYVTVKGLVERKVKSDLAIWPLNYKVAGDDLASVYAKTERDKKTILDFLAEQGTQGSEIEVGSTRVIVGGNVVTGSTIPLGRGGVTESGSSSVNRQQDASTGKHSSVRVDWRGPTPKVDELLHEGALQVFRNRGVEARASSGGRPRRGGLATEGRGDQGGVA